MTILLFGCLVMLAKPNPEPYNALSFVVHILSPSIMIAGIINPCVNITSDISDCPVTIAPIAPKANISEFPTRKAITVVDIAVFLSFENLVKSGVKVPPLMNVPTTAAKAALIVIVPEGLIASNPDIPPTSPIAFPADTLPSIAIAGTAIILNIVSDFIPK